MNDKGAIFLCFNTGNLHERQKLACEYNTFLILSHVICI